MAKAVRVLKDELAALKTAARLLPSLRDRGATKRHLEALIAKIEAPTPVKVPGLSLIQVEMALCNCRKYARWIGGSPARHLATLQGAQATPEQIAKVGEWLDHQPWMRGRWTLGSLAAKWGEWLSQAVASAVTVESTESIGQAPAGFND